MVLKPGEEISRFIVAMPTLMVTMELFTLLVLYIQTKQEKEMSEGASFMMWIVSGNDSHSSKMESNTRSVTVSSNCISKNRKIDLVKLKATEKD